MTPLTPEQEFVKTLFTKGSWDSPVVKWPRGYWKKMRERVEVTAESIKIIDTHPDQPGRVLVELLLYPGYTPEMAPHVDCIERYYSATYPFLRANDNQLWSAIHQAVKKFLQVRGWVPMTEEQANAARKRTAERIAIAQEKRRQRRAAELEKASE